MVEPQKPLHYDRGTNFFGSRWREDDFDDLMEGVVDKLNNLPDDQAGLDVAVSELLDQPTSSLTTKLTNTFGGVVLFTDPRIGGVGDGVTDNTAAWNAAMALLAPTGGQLVFPSGVYCISGTTNPVPGGVWLRGTGFNYGAPAGSAPEGAVPQRGAVIRATAVMSRLVQLGTNATTSPQSDTGASLTELILDGQNLADSVVKTAGRRNYILNCQVYWGAVNAIHIAGQNSYVIGGVQSQDNRGDVILMSKFFDHKVFDAQQRQPGTTGACIRVKGVSNVLIRGNHMWTGQNGILEPGEGLIVVEGGSAVVGIVDNIIEGIAGPEIKFKVTTAAESIQNVQIVGNQIFNNENVVDVAHPVIEVQGGTGGFITDVTIQGNTVRGQGSGKRFKSFINYTATLTGTGRWVVTGNSIFCAQYFLTGSANAPHKPKAGVNAFYDGSANRYTQNGGERTANGDGTAKLFTITTDLIAMPEYWSVTPMSSACMQPFYTYLVGSNIVVELATAPAAGTGNVKFKWFAGTSG